MVRKGKEMFTNPAALQVFEDLLKAKRNIKTNITNRIKISEQDLAESSTECPERLATAAKTYFRGMIDMKHEELVLDKKATDKTFLAILAAVEEINPPEIGAQKEEWVKFRDTFQEEWNSQRVKLANYAVFLEEKKGEVVGPEDAAG